MYWRTHQRKTEERSGSVSGRIMLRRWTETTSAGANAPRAGRTLFTASRKMQNDPPSTWGHVDWQHRVSSRTGSCPNITHRERCMLKCLHSTVPFKLRHLSCASLDVGKHILKFYTSAFSPSANVRLDYSVSKFPVNNANNECRWASGMIVFWNCRQSQKDSFWARRI